MKPEDYGIGMSSLDVRVWYNGKMHEENIVSVLSESGYYLGLASEWVRNRKAIKEEAYIMQSSHNICTGAVIVRFTGLKDKEGKKICEGDIVSAKAGYFPSLGVVYIDPHQGPSLNGDGLAYSSDIEVLGNIFENSDLLETNG